MIRQHLTMGQYVAISGLLWAVSNPMRNLGHYVNDCNRFMASASKIIEVYYAAPMIVDRADAKQHEDRLCGEIEFVDVSFDIGDKQILSNVSFHIKPGETVAIMGSTGSGKTSLINLIPRFFDVTSGKVLIDGVDVKMHRLETLRKNISVATMCCFIQRPLTATLHLATARWMKNL